jgi:hypothetical protein
MLKNSVACSHESSDVPYLKLGFLVLIFTLFFVKYLLVLCYHRRLQLCCCIFFSSVVLTTFLYAFLFRHVSSTRLTNLLIEFFCNIFCRKAKFPYLMLHFNYLNATSKHVVNIRVCPFQYNGPQNPIVS